MSGRTLILPRELFDAEPEFCAQESLDRSGGVPDAPLLHEGKTKRLQVGRCMDFICVGMKGELKRSNEVLDARLRIDERDENNYETMNARLEESHRNKETELRVCESK